MCVRERDERRGKNLEKQRVKMCGCWGFMTEDCEDKGWMAVTYVCMHCGICVFVLYEHIWARKIMEVVKNLKVSETRPK